MLKKPWICGACRSIVSNRSVPDATSRSQVKYWGGRIRTSEYRFQRPVPYHLATPQDKHSKFELTEALPRNLQFEVYSFSTILWKYSQRGNGFVSFTRKRPSRADPARIASDIIRHWSYTAA